MTEENEEVQTQNVEVGKREEEERRRRKRRRKWRRNKEIRPEGG